MDTAENICEIMPPSADAFEQVRPRHYRVNGIIKEEDIIEMALDIAERKFKAREYISESWEVTRYLRVMLCNDDIESLWLIHLDSSCRVIHSGMFKEGSADSVTLNVREIAREAVRYNSRNVILVHNHPTGDPTPSDSDRVFTERVAIAMQTVGVTMIDHLIVAKGGHYSFAADQLLD